MLVYGMGSCKRDVVLLSGNFPGWGVSIREGVLVNGIEY